MVDLSITCDEIAEFKSILTITARTEDVLDKV
jgi:hypothetical protein